VNNNRFNENNTPIPSPECATNHLDYDCSNDFCPRRRHVVDWIDNKRKKLRNLGKEYKSHDGTTRLAKSLKPMCLENCRQMFIEN
ncbi:hypothetical protein HW555_008147, partial [Spodoptera exigua]